MTSPTIVLDSEAVQALSSPAHPKHRRVLAMMNIVAQRKRRSVATTMIVPTSVRVEAGWDRTMPGWATANRLRISDVHLDRRLADSAAAIRRRVGDHISVVDAHIGAVLQSIESGQTTVLTSDPDRIAAVAEGSAKHIVRI